MENERIEEPEEPRDVTSIQGRFDEIKNNPELQKSIANHPSNISKIPNNGKGKP